MARRNIQPMFLLCVLSCLAQIGSGLECYKCSTLYYNDCENLQDRSKAEVEICPHYDGPTFCSKLTFQFENKKHTHRGCTFDDDCSTELEQIKQLYPIDAFSSCSFCSGELCNSATSVGVTATIFVTVMTSVYMLI